MSHQLSEGAMEEIGKHMSWLVRSDIYPSLVALVGAIQQELKDGYFAQDEIDDKDRLKMRGALMAYQGLLPAIEQFAETYESSMASADGKAEVPTWADSESVENEGL